MPSILDIYNASQQPQETDKPFWNDAYEVGRQLAAGFAVDLPRMVGQGLRRIAPDGSALDEFGRRVVENAYEREAGWAPDLEGRGVVAETMIKGARAVGPMAPGLAAAFLPGGQVLSPLAVGATFGLSQAQDTEDKLRLEGVSPDEATRAGIYTGAIQGLGEAVATYLGLKAAGFIRPLLPKVFGVQKTVQGVVGKLTDQSVVKPFLKGMGTNLLVQPATEVAQDVSTEFVERAYGAQPTDAWEIAKDSAQSAIGLTALLGPLAFGGNVAQAQRARTLEQALNTEDPLIRRQAEQIVAQEAQSYGIPTEQINGWLTQRQEFFDLLDKTRKQQTEPIDLLDSNLDAKTTLETNTGLIEPINFYNLGGYVDALNQNIETDVVSPQLGLFGGGGASTLNAAQQPELVAPLELQTAVEQANRWSEGPWESAAETNPSMLPGVYSPPNTKLDLSTIKLAETDKVSQPPKVTVVEADKRIGVHSRTARQLLDALDDLELKGLITAEQVVEQENAIAQATNKSKAYDEVRAFIRRVITSASSADAQTTQSGVLNLPQAAAPVVDTQIQQVPSVGEFRQTKKPTVIVVPPHVDTSMIPDFSELAPSQTLPTEVPNVGISNVSRPGVGGSSIDGGDNVERGVAPAGRVPDAAIPVSRIANGVRSDVVAPATPAVAQPGKKNAVSKPEEVVKQRVAQRRVVLPGDAIDFEALDVALEGVDPRMQLAVRWALGVDSEGYKLSKPLSADAAAKKAKLGENSGAAVNRVLNALGLTYKIRTKFAASEALGTGRPDLVEDQQTTARPFAEEAAQDATSTVIAEPNQYDNAAETGAAKPSLNFNKTDSSKKLPNLITLKEYTQIIDEGGFTSASPQTLAKFGVRAAKYVDAYAEGRLDKENSRALVAAMRAIAQRQKEDPTFNATYTALSRKLNKDATVIEKQQDKSTEVTNDEEGGVKPSLQQTAPSGPVHTAKSLTKALQSFVRANSLGDRIVVVNTANELSQYLTKKEITELIAKQLTGQRAIAFAGNNKAYFIADRTLIGRERGLFMHEVGAHIGLERLLTPQQFNKLVKQITQWAKRDDKSIESQVAKRAYQRVLDADTDILVAKQELVAYFLEEAINANIDPSATKIKGDFGDWLRLLWQKFKIAMVKLGVAPNTLTAQDIVDFAYGTAVATINEPLVNRGQKQTNLKFSVQAPEQFTLQPDKVVRENINKLPPVLRGPTRVITNYLRKYSRKTINTAAFTTDLLDRAVNLGLRSAKQYKDLYNEKATFVGTYRQQLASYIARFSELPESVKGRDGPVNRLLRDSTREGKWAFQPDWLDEPVEVDAEMAARFNALPAEAQAFVVDSFRFGYQTLETKKQIIRDTVTSEYDVLIEHARKEGDKKAIAQYKKDRDAALKQFGSIMRLSGRTPYMPLKRFGNYVVIAKSNEYLAAEKAAEETGDYSDVNKMQRDERHYSVDFVETMGDAEVLVEKLKAETDEQGRPLYSQMFDRGVFYRERELLRNELYGGSATIQALAKLRANIDQMYGKREAEAIDSADAANVKQMHTSAKKLQDMVTELYIMTLAEDSARRSELRRKGVAGDIDMIRSFETQGMADAEFLGGAKYSTPMLMQLNNMRRELRSPSGASQLEKSEIFNEILARHIQGSEYNPSPVIDKITRLTSLWFLAFSPAYYIQNATQPWLMSLPYMLGRHKEIGATSKALADAYASIAPAFTKEKVWNNVNFDVLLAPENKNLTDGEKQMLRDLLNKQQLDIGMATELGRFTIEGRGKLREGVRRIDESLSHLLQKTEALNRISTALAAYRLEIAKGGTHEQASAYASEVIYNTHGDYSAWNAPRAFNTKLGKIALQFRKFQLIQLSLLFKLWKNSFGDAPPAEKAAARRALTYTMGTALLFGGMRAMPIPAVAWWLLSSLFSEAGEPPEYLLRQAIGDNALADILIGGLPAAIGVNTSMMGFGNTFAILPFTDIDLTNRQGVAQTAYALFGGPVGGLGYKVSDGVAKMLNGEYWQGLESLLPRGFGSAMKAIRMGTEGITQADGDVTMKPDDYNMAQLAMQLVGLTPEIEVRRMYNQRTAYKVQENLRQREQNIKAAYRAAIKAKDQQAIQKARQEWLDYNESRAKLGFTKKPMKILLESVKEQAQRERQTLGGVQYRRENEQFVRNLTGLQ